MVRIAHSDGWAELTRGTDDRRRRRAPSGPPRRRARHRSRSVRYQRRGLRRRAGRAAFLGRGGDWLVGGRIAQDVLGCGAASASRSIRRATAEIAAHREVGVDLALHPIEWFDLSARGAYDLIDLGISEVLLGGGVRFGILRARCTGRIARRRASCPRPRSSRCWATCRRRRGWRAGRLALRRRGSTLGSKVERATSTAGAKSSSGRATLRLDDRGRGMLALEAPARRSAGGQVVRRASDGARAAAGRSDPRRPKQSWWCRTRGEGASCGPGAWWRWAGGRSRAGSSALRWRRARRPSMCSRSMRCSSLSYRFGASP